MSLSPEIITRLRHMAKTSTNEVAKNGAIEKLKQFGIPLEEEESTKKEEPKEEPKKQPKAKKEKAPKRTESEEDDADCDELNDLEEKGKKVGYDHEKELEKFIQRRKEQKARKEANKNKPKLSPAQKTKKTVEKSTEKVVSTVSKRGKQGKLTEKEIIALIEKYKVTIEKLTKMLSKLKKGEKFETGGMVDSDYSAKKAGKRNSKDRSYIKMRGGEGFIRKNGNQFHNENGYYIDSTTGRKRKTRGTDVGDRQYSESRKNRSDKNKFE